MFLITFQQSLLDVPGIRDLKKKLQIKDNIVVNNDCLRQGFICTKTDLGYHHTCSDEKDVHEIHMAAHGWSIFSWGSYTVPAMERIASYQSNAQ